MDAYKTISAKEFSEMDRSGYTVVDLREPDDVLLGEIKGAVNIPAEQIMDQLERIPKDAPVILICYVGLSSEQTAEKLAAGLPYVIRQRIPHEGTTTFHDESFGDITVENATLDD
ncbi:MAG: hypothetical protein J6P58_07160, partial [Oscillospiraceae bacterium]|nr:hypothetical protein [Oscillospiraceae bacterium]